MAQSFANYSPSVDVWVDITAVDGYGGLAGQQVTVQYKGGHQVYVYFGGAAAPGGGDGGLAYTGDVIGSSAALSGDDLTAFETFMLERANRA